MVQVITPLLSADNERLWKLAKVLGLVVVVAVAALLTILVMLVRTIEQRVAKVKQTLLAAET
ncbi:MAG: hypothetical protein WAW88_00100, partial [Nocardioides sp.]